MIDGFQCFGRTRNCKTLVRNFKTAENPKLMVLTTLNKFEVMV